MPKIVHDSTRDRPDARTLTTTSISSTLQNRDATASSAPKIEGNRPLSPVAFIGGAALALVIGVGAAYCCWRRRRRVNAARRRRAQAAIEMGTETEGERTTEVPAV